MDRFLADLDIPSSPVRPTSSSQGASSETSSPFYDADAPSVLPDPGSDSNIDPALRTSSMLYSLTGPTRTPAPITRAARISAQLRYLDKWAVRAKIGPEQKRMALEYINASPDEQDIIRLVYLLTSSVPAGGPLPKWEIPGNVKVNIDKYAIRLLLSACLATYDGDPPVDKLLSIVEQKLWGLPATIRKDDNDHWSILVSYAREAIVSRKSTIKKLLRSSYPTVQPIPEGSRFKEVTDYKTIVVLCDKMARMRKGTPLVTVTVQMCARVAFMRKTHSLHPYDSQYWKKLDDGLENIRKKANYQPDKVTKVFAAILEDDRRQYGMPNIDVQRSAEPLEGQSHADAVAAGRNILNVETQEDVVEDDEGEEGA